MSQSRQFSYGAVDLDGREVSGIMAGTSPEQVAAKLRQDGYFITAPIVPVAARAKLFGRRSRKLGHLTLALLAKKLGQLLQGGVPLLAALEVLQMESSEKKLARGLEILRERLYQGESLSKAVEHTGLFPHYFFRTVAIGELSGSLPEALAKLAQHYLDLHRLKQKIKRSFIYPSFVLAGIIFVLAAFIFLVLPETSKFLLAQGRELPFLTKVLLVLAGKDTWLGVGLLTGAGSMALIFLRVSARGKRLLSSLLWHLPVVAAIYRLFLYQNLSKSLGTMLANGISLLEALDSTRTFAQDHLLQQKLTQVAAMVSQGAGLTGALKEARLFAPAEQELLRAAEEAGDLGQIFHYLAGHYEEELAGSLEKLSSSVEPVIILLLTLLVGLVVGGIILPMYEFTGL